MTNAFWNHIFDSAALKVLSVFQIMTIILNCYLDQKPHTSFQNAAHQKAAH